MPCSLCRQQNRAALLPRPPNTSQNLSRAIWDIALSKILSCPYSQSEHFTLPQAKPHIGWLPPTNTYLSPVGRSARQDRRTSSQQRTEQYRTAGRVLQVRADRNVLAYMTGGSNAARRAPAKRDRSVNKKNSGVVLLDFAQ